jgi:AsmA protein
VEEARARPFDCDLTGNPRGSYAKDGLEAHGRIGVKGTSLRQTLAKLGMEDVGLNPALLQAFSGAAAVAVSPGKLALSEMEGRIDQSRFSGSLSGQWGQRPVWQGNVQVDALNPQSYLDTGPAPKKLKPWNWKWLQDFDAGGVVAVRSLRLLGMHFRQASSPVRLSGGVLELAPIAADLYGGIVTAQIRLNAKEAPDIQASVRASGVDLRGLTDELGTDTVYSGKASVRLELAGPARSSADIPAGLNGRFFCESGSGSMQARKALQNKEASPTRFDTFVIAGPVERGVFRSERFQLDGPTLHVGGGGWISMPEKTLDLKLEVRRTGVPAFPVHVHGKIDKPQTSVRAGQAFARAVGKLGLGIVDGIETAGSGLLDVVGGVLAAPLKLLK